MTALPELHHLVIIKLAIVNTIVLCYAGCQCWICWFTWRRPTRSRRQLTCFKSRTRRAGSCLTSQARPSVLYTSTILPATLSLSLPPVRTLVFVDPGSILVRLAGGGSMRGRERKKERKKKKETLMSLWLSAFDIIFTFPCRFIFPIIDLPFCSFLVYLTGSLNAHKVYIVSKNRLMSDRSGRSGNTKSSSTASSQFEQSFRVQVSPLFRFDFVVTNELL